MTYTDDLLANARRLNATAILEDFAQASASPGAGRDDPRSAPEDDGRAVPESEDK